MFMIYFDLEVCRMYGKFITLFITLLAWKKYTNYSDTHYYECSNQDNIIKQMLF